MRSCQNASGEDPVFVELKKKYRSVVYKRRLVLPERQVMSSFRQGKPLPVCSQIGKEIGYDDLTSAHITLSGGAMDLTCNGAGNTALDCDGAYACNGGSVTTNDGSENNPGQTGGMGGRPGGMGQGPGDRGQGGPGGK